MGFLILLCGVAIYGFFFATFLYLIAFVGGDMLAFLGAPKTIDSGVPPEFYAGSAVKNIGLMLLFAVPHTIMARKSFKNRITKILSPSLERSFYVLTTSVLLVAIFTYWQPMPAVVWAMEPGLWSNVMMVGFFAGFGITLLSTFLLNHFELFGLQQVWCRFKGQEMPDQKFRTPFLYKHMRHPLYFGMILAFWCSSAMSAGHLLFASVMTIYVFVAVGYEERDLISHFGETYHDYMSKVPSIMPFGRHK